MIRSYTTEAATRLGESWEAWEIYWVPRATGKPVVTWHARRRDDHKRVISARSPEELELELALAEEG